MAYVQDGVGARMGRHRKGTKCNGRQHGAPPSPEPRLHTMQTQIEIQEECISELCICITMHPASAASNCIVHLDASTAPSIIFVLHFDATLQICILCIWSSISASNARQAPSVRFKGWWPCNTVERSLQVQRLVTVQ